MRIKTKRSFGIFMTLIGVAFVMASKQITGAAIGVSGFSWTGFIGAVFFIGGVILTYSATQPREVVRQLSEDYERGRISVYDYVFGVNEVVGGIQEVHFNPGKRHTITTPSGILSIPLKNAVSKKQKDLALEAAIAEWGLANRNNPKNHSEIHGGRNSSTKHHKQGLNEYFRRAAA